VVPTHYLPAALEMEKALLSKVQVQDYNPHQATAYSAVVAVASPV
jgi:hypothetical protein